MVILICGKSAIPLVAVFMGISLTFDRPGAAHGHPVRAQRDMTARA
jgi:hypothetical protein